MRRVANQLAGGTQIELFAHVAAVRIDRLHRQLQDGNLSGADAVADQANTSSFALVSADTGIVVPRRAPGHLRSRRSPIAALT